MFQVHVYDLNAVLPLLILAGSGMVVLMWDAFEKRPSRTPLWLAVAGCIGAVIAGVMNLGDTGRAFGGMILNNGFAAYYSILFSIAALLSVLLAERYLSEERVLVGEFAGLVLFAACGMVMMASGNDLIVTFLGLETMSIAFYVLSGLFRRRQESNEAALKYFLLGSFASGFLLYGIALLYGAFGSTNLDTFHKLLLDPVRSQVILSLPLFWLGVALLLVGFAFKVAAFPFHQWAPDVYDGAPTVVTGFMSTAGKAGAFSAMVLIFNIAIGPALHGLVAENKLHVLLGTLAVLSMYYGNITAIAQTNIKRMLAYSSIAHAGYMMLGTASLTEEGAGAVTIYLTMYLFMQLGAFGVIALLEKESGTGLLLSDYAGLAKRRPWLAFIMAVMMLSLAGIPPMGGFFGKYYLFTAAIRSGLTMYAVLGIIASLISVYFYLRIVVLMYFREQEGHASDSVVMSGGAIAIAGTNSSWAALVIASIGIFALGFAPMILTDLAKTFFGH